MRIWLAGPSMERLFASFSPAVEAGGRLFPYAPSDQGVGVIEWVPGSSDVGDFVWSEGHGFALTTRRAAEVLAAGGVRGWTSLPVQMWQEPSITKPRAQRRVGARRRRVWLPYEGPPLREMHITRWAHLDRERSTYKPPIVTDSGLALLPPRGVEWCSVNDDGSQTWHHRRANRGYFVPATQLAGDSVFRLCEWPHVLMVTDHTKDVIERAGLTNIEFLEYGEAFTAR